MAKKDIQTEQSDLNQQKMEKYGVRTTAKKLRKTKTVFRFVIIIVLILFLLLSVSYACVHFANQAGRFTVSLDPNAMKQYGIILSEHKDGSESAVQISGTCVEDMNNITEEYLPKNIDGNYEGSHNGDADHDGRDDFIAYTFYLKHTGKEKEKYNVSIDVLSTELGADEALRVKVYRNGEAVTYGKRPVKGTENNKYAKFGIDKFFTKPDKVMDLNVDNFKPGDTDKYTVVIWLEGWDPECVDDILGGEVKLSMTFHIIDTEADSKELV